MEKQRMAKAQGRSAEIADIDMQTSSKNDNEESAEAEKDHFITILSSFQHYKQHCLLKLRQADINYKLMPEHHQKLVPNYRQHLKQLYNAVTCNDKLIQAIVSDTKRLFENQEMPSINETTASNQTVMTDQYRKSVSSSFQMDKVQSTLKQFVRDWSENGEKERKQCYQPLIDHICKLYPESQVERSAVHILVPGAGLGRLAYEFANRGFSSQGNEFSYYMLLSSYFILNRSNGVKKFQLYPYVTQFCNNLSSADQLQLIEVPDVDPSQVRQRGGEFSMIAGDFLEAYRSPGAWHAVVSSFFLDTAHNVVDYLERVYHILRPGGYFLNVGPLLYHYADLPQEYSVELSYEQIRGVLTGLGFTFVHEDLSVASTYTQNQRSMMHYSYNCVFFVCRKPADGDQPADGDHGDAAAPMGTTPPTTTSPTTTSPTSTSPTSTSPTTTSPTSPIPTTAGNPTDTYCQNNSLDDAS